MKFVLVQMHKQKKALKKIFKAFVINPGNDLLSHQVSLTVPLALRGLTSVFGMGTGVTPSLESPR
jgi:hypothetical protein